MLCLQLFADRPSTLQVQEGANPVQTVKCGLCTKPDHVGWTRGWENNASARPKPGLKPSPSPCRLP
jgi:hypothetical protein